MAAREKLLGGAAVRALIFATLAGSGIAPALAQQGPAEQSDQPPSAGDLPNVSLAKPEAETAIPKKDKDIVITGSRIRRNEFNSPTPIQVLDPKIGEKKGQLDTASLIQGSSIAAGSAQLTSTISSKLDSANGGKGVSTVSLRGLGANRTLVLLNGRRAGPAGTRGAVSAFDLNVLPSSIVSSVEIVKTGASPVYGSDAIAGVVNILTKRKTNGLELDAFTSFPFKEGGEEFRASATWGREFSRGHILASVDYYHQNELKRGDRSYLNCPQEYIFKPHSRQRADIVDPRTGKFRCEDSLWGQIWLYDYQKRYGAPQSNLIASNGNIIKRLQFDYDGNLGQFIPPLTGSDPLNLHVPPGWFPTGYDRQSKSVENAMHPFISDSSFIPKTNRLTLYAEGSYELSDHIEYYGEFLANRRKNYQNGFKIWYQYITFPEDFANLGFGDPFSKGFSGAVLISPTPITDHGDNSQRVDYVRGVSGLRGDFGKLLPSWTYDGYVQYSRSDGHYTTDQIFQDSLDSQNLRTGSCVGTVTAVRQAPCIDINFVNPDLLSGKLTQAERDFLFGSETGRTLYTQWDSVLSATGNVVDLPAGPVAAALGIEWRRDEINDTPGDITHALLPGHDPKDPASYVNNAFLASAAGVTAGWTVAKEAFGEIEVPLIYNTPLIDSFTLSGAGRVSSVEATRAHDHKRASDNGNWTYSVGANWNVNRWLRFRGTYGTSFRAPALFEQFLADQTDFVTQRAIDPCINWGSKVAAGTLPQIVGTNCAADGIPADYPGGALEALVTTGGGLGVVKSETSKALTGSVVLSPKFSFLPDTNFDLAVDYFDIKVKGEISELGARQILLGCYSSQFFPNEPLCNLFTRAPAGSALPLSVQTVRDALININSEQNRGIDFTGRILQDLGSWGRLSFLTQMTWQLKDTVALFSGTEVSNNGEAGEPKWVGNFSLNWDFGPNSLFYGIDAVGSTSNESDFLKAMGTLCPTNLVYGNYCVDVTSPAVTYHHISFTHRFKQRIEATIGITNLFDKKPPRETIEGGTLNANVVHTVGQSLLASQYDYIGRRLFFHLKAGF